MYTQCPSIFMSEFLAGISMFSLAVNVVIFCFMRPKVVNIQFDQIDLFDTMVNDHHFVRSKSVAGDDKDSGSESDETTSTTTQSPDSTNDDKKPTADSYFGYFT